MCRNIKPLFNFDPPANDNEIHDASLQFVRKISGYHHSSQVNEDAFNRGVEEVADAVSRLLKSLVTDTKTKNREEETAKARARFDKRFA
jgi:hypothetical protein